MSDAAITAVMRIGEKIKRAREARGLSQVAVARAIGISQAAIDKLESGRTRKSRYASDVAQYLGIDTSAQEVPVVGFVGAGSEAHFYGEGQGPLSMTEGPVGSTDRTVAVIISGQSLGPMFDRWLAFYDDVRSPVTQDLIGKLCIVGIPDGRVLIKQLQRSRVPNLFHLISQTEPPMLDVPVEWAARVKQISPQ